MNETHKILLTIWGVDKYPTPNEPTLYLTAGARGAYASKNIITINPDDYWYHWEKETLDVLEKTVSGGVWKRKSQTQMN